MKWIKVTQGLTRKGDYCLKGKTQLSIREFNDKLEKEHKNNINLLFNSFVIINWANTPIEDVISKPSVKDTDGKLGSIWRLANDTWVNTTSITLRKCDILSEDKEINHTDACHLADKFMFFSPSFTKYKGLTLVCGMEGHKAWPENYGKYAFRNEYYQALLNEKLEAGNNQTNNKIEPKETPKLKPCLNVRPGCPIFDGWYAIGLDEVCRVEDRIIKLFLPSMGSCYENPNIQTQDTNKVKPNEGLDGMKITDVWGISDQKSYAVYRRIPGSTVIPSPSYAIVSFKSKRPFNKFHSMALPLP